MTRVDKSRTRAAARFFLPAIGSKSYFDRMSEPRVGETSLGYRIKSHLIAAGRGHHEICMYNARELAAEESVCFTCKSE